MKKISLGFLLLATVSLSNLSATEHPQELTDQQKANLLLVRGVRTQNFQMITNALEKNADVHLQIQEIHFVTVMTPLLAYSIKRTGNLNLIMKIAAEVQIPEHFSQAIQNAKDARWVEEDDALFSEIEKNLHRLQCEKAQQRHRKSFYTKEESL